MTEDEPRLRRRGMFFSVETSELDDTEHDSAEGISIRQGPRRRPTQGPSPTAIPPSLNVSTPGKARMPRHSIRSASATGSRQQAQMSR
jgi:hypothetical protein